MSPSSVGVSTDCVLVGEGRSGGVSRAKRLASSALWKFLGSRVSASAVADLVRVESTRVSLSFPLFPSLTDELLRRVPVSAVRSFPYTVEEGRDNRAGTHTNTYMYAN